MNNFIEKLDLLFKNNEITTAEKFINETIEFAQKNQEYELLLVALNEGIGFYRDLTKYEQSISLAKILYNIIKDSSKDKKYKAICYINIANAYRAYGDYETAIRFFLEAKKYLEEGKLLDSYEYASLLNNLGLVYQQKDENLLAIENFNAALQILTHNSPYQIASTYVNIACCMLNMNDLNAGDYLKKASEIFKENDSDFHYMFYLAQYGRYYNLIEDYINSKRYYEKALAYLMKNVGQNEVYKNVFLELKKVYEKLNLPIHEKGLDISKRYFDLELKNSINSLSELEKDKLIIGSFGFGSDKYGLDDDISEDHDFHPDIIILVDNDIKLVEKLKTIFATKINIFERYYAKTGFIKVYSLNEYFNIIHLNLKQYEYQSASLFLNGKIFYDKNKIYEKLSKKLKKTIEKYYVELVVKDVLEFGQIAQYNIQRLVRRDDLIGAKYLLDKLQYKVVKLVFDLNKKPLIHDKWQIHELNKLRYGNIAYHYIEKIHKLSFDEAVLLSHKFCKNIICILCDLGFIAKITTDFIEDYRNELLEFALKYYNSYDLCQSILELEWEMFTTTKNEGTRADCQDNYDYFKIMRLSQFYSWDYNTLSSYKDDLLKAKTEGYNLVTYKYAYMEKSTDLESYLAIENFLPKISESRQAIQEEIIKVQLQMLEDFYSLYPKAKEMMRITYTKDDTVNNTSYETYLRGELSSYSEKTMIAYASYLISADRKNINIVSKILKWTCLITNMDINNFR